MYYIYPSFHCLSLKFCTKDIALDVHRAQIGRAEPKRYFLHEIGICRGLAVAVRCPIFNPLTVRFIATPLQMFTVVLFLAKSAITRRNLSRNICYFLILAFGAKFTGVVYGRSGGHFINKELVSKGEI